MISSVKCRFLGITRIHVNSIGGSRVPSIFTWIAVEGAVDFAQFTLIGIVLGLTHLATRPLPAKS